MLLVALACVTGLPAAPRAQSESGGPASFVVLLDGVRAGSETVVVSRTGTGWTVAGSGRTTAPVDLVTTRFEMTYGPDWQPVHLVLQGTARTEPFGLDTNFGLTTATNTMAQGADRGTTSHQVLARSVVLPASFFGAYEALALRLRSEAVGATLPVYVAPDGDGTATIDRIAPKQVSLGGSMLDLREFALTVRRGGSSIPLELWIDSRGRLARLVLPGSSIVVLRDDLASVMAREVRITRAGDEDAFITANGFTLGATVSKPSSAPPKAPAVVLVGPTGPQDRDLTLYGIPIFGQLAGTLADAGYLVVRYDQRGVGRSGGRTENASLAEYADDLVRTIGWLRKRRDVDGERIAVAAYGEGGAIAMVAAGREKKIKALALLASPGRAGREVALEEQRQLLARLAIPESEKAARVALQMRVIDAATGVTSLESLPPEMRASAASPWFRSWLTFDPAAAMQKIAQPLLVLHGALDRETDPTHGERLEALGRARKKSTPADTRRVQIERVNHLLVTAATGSVEEYASLGHPDIAPETGASLVGWLREVLAAR